jgi:hypothetical protein
MPHRGVHRVLHGMPREFRTKTVKTTSLNMETAGYCNQTMKLAGVNLPTQPRIEISFGSKTQPDSKLA